MKAIIAALFAFLSVSAAIAGDILIYSGTCVEYDAGDGITPVTRKAFVIFDVPTDLTMQSKGTVALLLYGKRNGQKHYQDLTYPMRATFVVRPDSKFVGTFSVAQIIDDQAEPAIFGHDAFIFRGLQTPLTIEVFGNLVRTANHPRTLKGSGSFSALGLFFTGLTQRTFSLRYDQPRTLVANAGNQTVAQVLTDLTNYVKSLGYSL
jgi:hypothetical protein